MTIANSVIGGGSFTGRALYDDGVFTGLAEDVSDIVTMISPFETPLLTELGDSERPAFNTYHEWLEDQLNPQTLYIFQATTPFTAGDTAFPLATVSSGEGSHLMIGLVLRNPVSDEYMQVTGATPNGITVERAFAGSTATTLAADTAIALELVSEAAVEGSDVLDDLSRSRTRKFNVCQIFKKDVIVSGTIQSVRHIGIESEMDHQIMQRTRENLVALEKAIVLSRQNTPAGSNYVGSATVTRTMKGLRQFITNVTTITSPLTNSELVNVMQSAWDVGGTDLDLLICGRDVKKAVDQLNEVSTATSRIVSDQMESFHRRIVTEYEGTFGRLRIVMSRWMPNNEGIILSRNRVKVVPLTGRSFQYEAVAKTGDANKGMIVGEYTLEVRNPEGMCRFIYTP